MVLAVAKGNARNQIVLGFEKDSGKSVAIGITHSVFAAITRAGKSETVRAAVQRSENVRFLILDVKRPRDYADLGVQVPIYIEEKTEPLMLKRLLESQSHLALKFEFPELLKVCKKATTYPEILEQVNKGLEAKTHPIVKDKLLVLQHLLTRLVTELEQTPISEKLVLKNRVNVMDLADVSKEMQQLAVHSTLKELLKKHRDVVVIADEFHRFAPQYGSNASKETVTDYIKEGGAKNLWLWVIDQTITGVDKQILKQCWVWVLGKQRELNEAKRTLDQIPFRTSLTDKAIMRLKVGHFVVCTEDFAKITYIWLPDVPREMAERVSLGQLPVREVIAFLDKEREKGEEDDLEWKAKFEEEHKARKKLEGDKEQLKEALLKTDVTIYNLKQDIERLSSLEKDAENIQTIKLAFRQLLAIRPNTTKVNVPSELVVANEQLTLTVERVQKPLKLSQDDLEGRIALVYAEELLPKEKAFTTRHLNKTMEQRFGRKEAYANFPKVLTNFVAWGFFEKVQAGKRWDYRVKLSPQEAREKGLLRVVEGN